MPGRPILKLFTALVKARGGFAVLYDRIAAGEAVKAIAADYQVSRPFLYRELTKTEKAKELYRLAQQEAADALAEQAGEILDNAPEERDAIRKAELRANHRKWLATVFDKEKFGESKPGPTVQVTLGQLHLQAVSDHGVIQQAKADFVARQAKEAELAGTTPVKALPPPATEMVTVPKAELERLRKLAELNRERERLERSWNDDEPEDETP